MADTMRVAFNRGHTSFYLYGLSLSLLPFTKFFAHDINPKERKIQLTLLRDGAETDSYGEVRKIYKSTSGDTVFKSISLPTRQYLGFEREKNYSFPATEIPVEIIEEAADHTTISVDLSVEPAKSLIRRGQRKPMEQTVTKHVSEQPKKANGAHVTVARKVEAPKQSQRIILADTVTLGQLKVLGFHLHVRDAGGNEFIVD